MTALLLALMLVAHAEEKSAFEQALEHEGFAVTQERWVEYGGTHYREVEYNNGKYYIKFTGRQGEFAELDCAVPDQKPNMIQQAVSVYHRTRIFVSFLEEKCGTQLGHYRPVYKLDPKLGFTFPDDPHFPIKDRTVFLNPTLPLNLGFYGTW